VELATSVWAFGEEGLESGEKAICSGIGGTTWLRAAPEGVGLYDLHAPQVTRPASWVTTNREVRHALLKEDGLVPAT